MSKFQPVSCLKVSVAILLLHAVSINLSHAAKSIDPLSRGPIPLTEKAHQNAQRALQSEKLGTDQSCHFSTWETAPSEITAEEVSKDICLNRTNEIVFVKAKRAIVGCLSQKVDFSWKVSSGSNGIGKTVEGNRKSPNGTYWLGVPRASEKFGVFIPIGYPNMDEIAKGFTGQDVGIHGPIRFLKCAPIASLAGNWTAGCLALGRDSQLIRLSNWVLDHWPVKITMSAD